MDDSTKPVVSYDGGSLGPLVTVYEEQLSGDECELLIALIGDAKRMPAVDGDVIELSHERWPIVRDIRKRLAQLAQQPVDGANALQVLPSSDRLITGTPVATDDGGSREDSVRAGDFAAAVTVLCNLGNCGETVFPALGLSLANKRGRVIVAQTCYSDTDIPHPRAAYEFEAGADAEQWLCRLCFREHVAAGNETSSPLIFLSNRASRNFSEALAPFGARAYQPGDKNIDFLYFDTFQGKRPPENAEVKYSLMDRQRTVPLDNKAILAKRLVEAGICDPMVYLNAESVPRDPHKLWYIKDPLASAGRSVRVVRHHEIAEHFAPGYIIQEAVRDVRLIDGRKFTVRIYILVCNGRIYLYPEGILVVHGKRYEPDSTDLSVQVDHRGYDDPKSDVTMGLLSSLADHQELIQDIAKNAPGVFRVFANSLWDVATRYCLFGLDYLMRSDGNGALIEVNDRPNLLHTEEINKKVNIEMIRDMVAVVGGLELNAGDDYRQRFMDVGMLKARE